MKDYEIDVDAEHLTREERAFARDLVEIMKKHRVEVCSFDNEDGEGNCAGTTYYFKGNNIHIDLEQL